MTKGISPLVAAVLLIGFTMSLALLVGPFFTQTLKDTQEGTKEDTQELRKTSKADLSIEQTSFNSENGNYTITVQNRGQASISNFTATVYGDQPTQIKINKTLEPKEIHTFTIPTNKSKKGDKINIEAQNLPVSTEQSLENTVTGSAPASPTGLSLST